MFAWRRSNNRHLVTDIVINSDLKGNDLKLTVADKCLQLTVARCGQWLSLGASGFWT